MGLMNRSLTNKVRHGLSPVIQFIDKYTPNTATLLLLIGLLLAVLGKLAVIRTQSMPNPGRELLEAIFPDVLFFMGVLLAASCLYSLKPSALFYRCVFLFAILYVSWSVLNYVWLTKSGVQLSPGILMLLLGDFEELWPLVRGHIKLDPIRVVAMLALTLIALGFCAWQFVRPRKVIVNRIYHLRRATVTGCVLVVLFLSGPVVRWSGRSSFGGDVLSFSSHWHALTGIFHGLGSDVKAPSRSQNTKKAGERPIGYPPRERSELPNVVLVLLESVSYSFSSFNDANLGTTPYLVRLSKEGAHLEQTRVVMPFTTKAFWSVLTGVGPVIKHNYVEAVPIDGIYEGLPSILRRAGYRSAFFEVSKGTFNCAAGFFANFGFDWAWFRENLEDPSAHLGYVGGDDFRLLGPAFEWVRDGPEPFFLMVITSVAHDPFLVPAWFEKPEESVFGRYLQSVRFTDCFLQQLCRQLKDNGLENNTILCVIGDHGTSFVNRTSEIETRWVASEEIIRVPWVIRWPGHIEPGSVIKWPCSQLDVAPTILSLIGFDISSAGFEGQNAFGPSDRQRRLYFSSLPFDGPRGFVEGNTKVVYWPRVDKILQYNIVIDPGERNPQIVAAEEAERTKLGIIEWQSKTQIVIDPKRYTKRLFYSHWQTFSAGESAWAYYIP